MQHAPPPATGKRVLLKGLQAGPELTDAAGQVVHFHEQRGRFDVKLHSPPSAVTAKPEGVLVRASNLEVLPVGAARAVILSAPNMYPAYAFSPYASDHWQQCPVR